jgi:hypothetical protein
LLDPPARVGLVRVKLDIRWIGLQRVVGSGFSRGRGRWRTIWLADVGGRLANDRVGVELNDVLNSLEQFLMLGFPCAWRGLMVAW